MSLVYFDTGRLKKKYSIANGIFITTAFDVQVWGAFWCILMTEFLSQSCNHILVMSTVILRCD